MAKSPKEPRDPTRHSKKDPARPTRSKAHRPEAPPTEPTLARLLNPGIGKGTAGMGSGTGLRPPPDNSFERRADRRGEHTARKSIVQGFDEAPQHGYVARAPLDIDDELRKALGYGSDPTKPLIGGDESQDDAAGAPPAQGRGRDLSPQAGRGDTGTERDELSDIVEPRREKRQRHRPSPQPVTLGVTASMQALDRLLREGRPEFANDQAWVPHRPPRPDKSEGGVTFEMTSELSPKGDQPQAIRDLVEGANRHDRTQVLLGVTGSGKTFTGR